MVQRRERLCFSAEASHAIGIEQELAGQNLDRDVATQRGVARAIDLAHAARAERICDDERAEACA